MPSITHEQLQDQVTQLLRMTGWSWLHVRKSIGKGTKWATTTNVVGWPDLAPLWNPRQPGRHLAIELKIPPDKVSDEQAEVLASLASSGFETYVITPTDIDKLVQILKPRSSR